MANYIRRIFALLFAATALRLGVYPTSADTVAAAAVTITSAAGAWTWGAWGQIVAAAGVTAETKITGFTLENFAGAVAQGEVAIGSGGVGAEVELGRRPIAMADYEFPDPLYVPAASRLVARYRTATGAADTVDVKLLTETGF